MDEYATDGRVMEVLRYHASPGALEELQRTAAAEGNSLRSQLGSVVNEWATVRLTKAMQTPEQ